ncbi:hypothetical protein AK812_SmicGene38154 [Symbiodinium microadriaticum]|uniref:Microbial-type PARG catalytic domain-containing protein n=1 Tax=Symbiodinium microadriaticum TaxID=2951 RepID=A0A1Q9CEG0_SYMMI|nr:hypothetical protein AK812_SmicGene38154 [Symbiodinium microadriaticum]
MGLAQSLRAPSAAQRLPFEVAKLRMGKVPSADTPVAGYTWHERKSGSSAFEFGAGRVVLEVAEADVLVLRGLQEAGAHPNLLPVLDLFRADTFVFMMTLHCTGGHLGDALAFRKKWISPKLQTLVRPGFEEDHRIKSGPRQLFLVSMHGRSGYCDYCWQCWNGRIPEKAVSEGENFPRPEVCHYPNFNKLVDPVENQLLMQGVPSFEVDVRDEDFLAVALRLRRKYPNDPEPLILSPCSWMSSGGAAGPAGQSMLGALCRSTTWQPVAEKAFPIGSNHAVYVPGVRVYHVVGKPASNFSVSVLATPPPQFRDVSDSYYQDLLARMCGLIEICKLRGHRLLVIGAWGCGGRKHPPEAVARAFKQALGRQKDAFSHVIFAIKGAKKTLRAFQEEIKSDCWSAGCILFVTLTGRPAFNYSEFPVQAEKGKYVVPKYVPKDVTDFLATLLEVDYNKRADAASAYEAAQALAGRYQREDDDEEDPELWHLQSIVHYIAMHPPATPKEEREAKSQLFVSAEVKEAVACKASADQLAQGLQRMAMTPDGCRLAAISGRQICLWSLGVEETWPAAVELLGTVSLEQAFASSVLTLRVAPCAPSALSVVAASEREVTVVMLQQSDTHPPVLERQQMIWFPGRISADAFPLNTGSNAVAILARSGEGEAEDEASGEFGVK